MMDTREEWWRKLEAQRFRANKVRAIAAEHKIHLTTTRRRSFYEDTWSENVVDWSAVADLLDKVSPGWDLK